MSTSRGKKPQKPTKPDSPRPSRTFVPTTALAKPVKFDAEMMHVQFTDGRILSVPLIWFPILRAAHRNRESVVK
jgi:hypothetical protein